MLAATAARRRPAPAAGHRRPARDRLLARADRRASTRWRATRRARWPAALGIAVGALAVRGAAGDAARGAQRAAAGLGAARRRWPARCSPIVAVVAARRGLARVARDGAPDRRAAARRRGRRAPGACASAAGFAALGARLALARRGRAAASIAVLAVQRRGGAADARRSPRCSCALRDDPGTVGKRYQLTAQPARRPRAPTVRALPGVADAAPRYVVQGADSFALGEPVRLVAFPGDHTRFEDPPLAAGRRLRGERRGRGRRRAGRRARAAAGLDARRPAAERRRGALPRRRASCARSRTTAASPTCAPRALLAADPGASAADRGPARRPAPTAPRSRARLRDARRAAAPRSAARPRATAPSSASLAALLRGVGARRRARLPLRAGPGARRSTARERAPTLALLRATAPRASPSAPCWPARRSPSRCPPRSSRSRSSGSCSPRSSARLAAGYADLGAAVLAPARPRWSSAGWRCWASWPPRWSRGGRSREPLVAGLREE